MKRLLLAGVALSVASAASAADLRARPYAKAAPPAAVVAAYNWSGFYIGAMGGYGWESEGDGGGGFGGGTIGYNWQLPGSQFVFGVEVDAAGASIKDSLTLDGGGVLATEEIKINSFGSVTGRAGFALDAALIYAKGGFAWANRKDSLSIPALGVSDSDSQSHTGYTIGGGLEYLFTPNWSAKAEYMYTSLGSETYNLAGDVFDSGTVDFHTIKVGVNYHFR